MLPQLPRRAGPALLFAAAALVLACGEGAVDVDPAVVSFSPSTITFDAIAGGPNPPPQSVEVENVGEALLEGLGATITYTPSGVSWLGAASWDQRSAPAVLTLQATTGSLAAGTYAAHIAITGDGAVPDTLNVTFNVAPGPSIALSDSSITFEAIVGGVDPDLQQIAISNGGGGTLAGLGVGSIVFGPGASGWLMTPFAMSPTAPSSLTLLALTRNLAPGTYTAAVEVTGAGVTPVIVSVTFVVSTPPPILSLSELALEFVATHGAGNPASKSVQLSNGGGGTLTGLAVTSITYDPPGAAWLGNPQPSSATAPSVLTLEPQMGSLVPGVYDAVVTVAGTDVASRALGVTLHLEPPPPVIALSSEEVEFSTTQGAGNPTAQVIQITNGGGGTLAGLAVGSVTYDPPGTNWLGTPLLSSGSAPTQLTIAPQTGSLAAGTHRAAIRINGAGASPDTVEVTFEVLEPPPHIALSADAVEFSATEGGAAPTAQTVNVTNGGGGTLQGLAIGAVVYDPPGASWLAAPSLSSTTAPSVVTLQAQTGALTAGVYEATVEIVGVGVSPDTVLVTFDVDEPAPVLALSQDGVELFAVAGGDDPLVAEVTISNGGGGTLTGLAVGAIAYDPAGTSWLDAELSDATAPSTLSLAGVTGALAAGTYAASVEITGSGVAPDTVAVTFEVAEPDPVLVLSTTAAEFNAVQGGNDPAIAEITVSNGGGGTLGGLAVGTITFDPSGTTWLVAVLDDATAPTLLSLVPTTGTLVAGSYAATVEVTGNGVAPDTVAVTFVVDEPPSIASSSAEVLFEAVEGEGDPSPQVVVVTNGGGGVLEGLTVGSITYVPDTTAWLVTAELSSQTAPSDLTLAVETGTILSGTYQAIVEIVALGVAPDTVIVTFAVAEPPPSIALSTSQVQLAGVQTQSEPDAQTVDVTNGGGGTLEGLAVGSITYEPEGTSWLTVAALSSGTAPSVLTLDAEVGELADGIYTAMVEITGTGVAPDTVSVEFTVLQPPMIQLSTDAVDFARMYSDQGSGGAAWIEIENGGGGSLTGLTVGAIIYEGGVPPWLLEEAIVPDSAPAQLLLQLMYTGGEPPILPDLPEGIYVARVPISSPDAVNSPQIVTVTYEVRPDAPDFRVSNVTLLQSAIRLAHQTTITAYVRNLGTLSYDGCVTVRFYLNDGWSPWPGDVQIGDAITCYIDPNSEPVEVYWEDYTCCDVPEGDYYINAVVDPDNEVFEDDDDNNLGLGSDPIPVFTRPDFVVEEVLWSDDGFGNLYATALVSNNRANRPDATVDFYLSEDQVLDNGDHWLASDTRSVLGYQDFEIWPVIPFTVPTGTYHLIAAAQLFSGADAEWDTSNNIGVSPSPVFDWLAPYAVLGAVPSQLEFLANQGEEDPPSQSFVIRNLGGSTLTDLAVSAPYYAPGQATGWLVSPVLVDSIVTIQPLTGTLAVGTYGAAVDVSAVDPLWGGPANGSPRQLMITFQVQEPPIIAVPEIRLLDDDVDFSRQSDGTPPTQQTVTVQNSGDPGSILAGLAAGIEYVGGESDWLSAALDSTSIHAGSSAILTLAPTRHDLAPGTHTAVVAVTGTDATNAPQNVLVTYRVAGIALSMSAASFPTLGANTMTRAIAVTNSGGAPLTGLTAQVTSYGAGCSGWLTPTIGDTAPTDLTLTIAGGANVTCPPGAYTATVRVASPVSGNGSHDVATTYQITISYGNTVAPILANNCQGCHGSGSLNLTTGSSHASIVNTLTSYADCRGYAWRVVPGDASASYLLRTMDGQQPFGCLQMPTGALLSAGPRSIVRQWILEGAPRN